MNKIIISFLAGFSSCLIILSFFSYMRNRPVDFTKSLSVESGQMLVGILPWIKLAQGGEIGPLAILIPYGTKKEEALVYLKKDSFPKILFRSSGTGEKLESIMILDSKNRAIIVNDNDGDRIFDSYQFSDDASVDSYYFSDNNLDGNYDTRQGPGLDFYINIDGQWHSLIRKNGEKYIEINGVNKDVVQEKGVWRLKIKN